MLSNYTVHVDKEKCIKCKRCVSECGFDNLYFTDKVMSRDTKCVNCLRCVYCCPTNAISVRKNPSNFKKEAESVKDIIRQSRSGSSIITSCGSSSPNTRIFDNLLFDACQVTNPPIDPLREPMEVKTFLGGVPDKLDANADISKVELSPSIKLETPIYFGAMSFGSVNLNVQKSVAIAAKNLGTIMNCGEGGLHPELFEYSNNIIVQCASGRFGVTSDYLNKGIGVEIKIGQGAKAGVGGHLPGYKVNKEIAALRFIPEGRDALSPAPHHDVYSIEDLKQLIEAIKEATDYKKPIFVKVAAVHNIAAISSGIVRAGADVIVIDGCRGGTGATPKMIRDNTGIPIEIAIAVVDDLLRKEKIRNKVSLVASGGIRSSADVAKSICLGANAVQIASSALIALGCTLCQSCHTNNCSWGITTQRSELARKIDPVKGAENITRLVNAWTFEIKELMGSFGVNAIESIVSNREKLRAIGLSKELCDVFGVDTAGK
ncbi:alpha-hydroxy-acid oxidizing protein [Candidatus Woesearchaeota archaeon]|nr:alpha-hydroxy-acid oxidizing protein [Candidatus Woesearchaeota archaeon]